jgi:DNA-directed RNA polymerase subunit H (RpoH/RPB5)
MTDEISTMSIYNSRQHLLDILNECGYDVSDYTNPSLQHVAAMIENRQLNLLLTSPTNKVYVIYKLDAKINTRDNLAEHLEPLFEIDKILNKNDNVIIVYKSEPNDTIHAMLENLWNDQGILVSVINIERLQFNIFKHEHVPRHTILNEKEQQELFEKYNIKSNANLPVISRFDPVASVMCMRPGQVCSIERKSKTAVTSTYYRVCV